MPPPSPDAVKAYLAGRIVELAKQVAPHGKVQGREWEGHGPDGSKWGIVLYGQKIGHWQNFGSGAAGTSGLSLIRDAFCGGDHKAAWRWALRWLGEDPDRPVFSAPAPAPTKRAAQRNASAIGLYLHAEAFDWDRPAGLYLRGRGVDPAAFDHRPISALRFHANCWNQEAQRHMPAMVAAIVDPITRRHIATHRTYLEHDGARWRKARLEAAKKSLGAALGGVIPLTRGWSNQGLGKAPPGDLALLGEGIENVLTVAQWEPDRRALAYISAGNLAALELPETLADLVLIRDRDGENLPVERTRQWTIAHWLEEGRTVAIWQPPPGIKDANDYWLGERQRVRA